MRTANPAPLWTSMVATPLTCERGSPGCGPSGRQASCWTVLDDLQNRVYSILHEHCYLYPGFISQRPEDRQPARQTGSLAETPPLQIGAMVRGSRECHDHAAGRVSTSPGRHFCGHDHHRGGLEA